MTFDRADKQIDAWVSFIGGYRKPDPQIIIELCKLLKDATDPGSE